MADVQALYFGLSVAGLVAGLIWAGGAATLAASGQARPIVATTLLKGGLFTLGLLAAIASFMVISWGQFFTTFHRIFFEGDTWIFPRSDTLIRLFPNRFWIDIGATIVGLLVVQSLAVSAGSWIWRRKIAGQDSRRIRSRA
jgi:integral membrane protein (TIGR01906 family)